MTGFDNFWNFKTMLDEGDASVEGSQSKPDFEQHTYVPFLPTAQLAASGSYKDSGDELLYTMNLSSVANYDFSEELKNLENLTISELQKLRRKIALHSHPDRKFRAGPEENSDLMSTANCLIDAEINRRS